MNENGLPQNKYLTISFGSIYEILNTKYKIQNTFSIILCQYSILRNDEK